MNWTTLWLALLSFAYLLPFEPNAHVQILVLTSGWRGDYCSFFLTVNVGYVFVHHDPVCAWTLRASEISHGLDGLAPPPDRSTKHHSSSQLWGLAWLLDPCLQLCSLASCLTTHSVSFYLHKLPVYAFKGRLPSKSLKFLAASLMLSQAFCNQHGEWMDGQIYCVLCNSHSSES